MTLSGSEGSHLLRGVRGPVFVACDHDHDGLEHRETRLPVLEHVVGACGRLQRLGPDALVREFLQRVPEPRAL